MTGIAEAQVNALARFKGKGRLAQGRKPDFYVYRIQGALASRPQRRTRKNGFQSEFRGLRKLLSELPYLLLRARSKINSHF